MTRQNKLLIAGIIVLFILTGFFREFVFLNWNEQMRVTYYHSPDPHVAPMMQWLGGFSYAALYYMKWPLTLLFSIVFATYSALIIRLGFGNKNFVRVTWIAYAVVFLASLLFFGFGMLLGETEVTYSIARFLAGLIETPAMLAILAATFLVLRRN